MAFRITVKEFLSNVTILLTLRLLFEYHLSSPLALLRVPIGAAIDKWAFILFNPFGFLTMVSSDIEQDNAAKLLDLKRLSDLLEANDVTEANALLQVYLDSSNPKRDSLFHAAELFLKHQQLDSAENAYQALLEMDETNVSVLGRLGDLAVRHEDYHAAIGLFRKIIELESDPENWVYIGLGNSYEAVGEIADAIECFQKAMETSEFKKELSIRLDSLEKKKTLSNNDGVTDAEQGSAKGRRSKESSKSVNVAAIGHLEVSVSSNLLNEAIVIGWLKKSPEVVAWLENSEGDKFQLDTAIRFNRQDVEDTHGDGFGHVNGQSGFIIRLGGIKTGEKIYLVAADGDEAKIIASTRCHPLDAKPSAAARWLFGLALPSDVAINKFAAIDYPIVDTLLRYEQQLQKELPVKVRQLGSPPTTPVVSLIIPLYGRLDFIESQLVEFSKDAWLIEHAEIIYVLDDPKLYERLLAMAENLHRLYRIPFKWLWGGVNRGFSGANNLGADHAAGDYLLFLNSDVFPQAPGWIEPLLDVLKANPKVGAVGPRLVFANGAIQHASMSFLRREELGIWVNHHPYMGLDPALDPAKSLTIVPAVTGACMVMRRSDFDRVGGWDTGYLIGDFEDSDLCLKLHSTGFEIAYLPTVQLTHLERQSFKLMGQNEFRFKVVIYNGLRHQSRWQHLIEKLADQNEQ